MSTRTPVLFLSHGAGPAAMLNYAGTPFEVFDKNSLSAQFMRTVQKLVSDNNDNQPINSILVVSAHWEETEFTVDYQTGQTKLLYDYYGFPEEAYAPHLTYPVPTDLKLAEKVHGMISAAGMKSNLRAREGGFDHGVFAPMKLAFPEAKIPVVQVSLRRNLDLATHIRLGEVLAPLRKEGVLIIGSGQITHNMSEARGKPGVEDKRATAFTNWIRDLLEGTNESNYEERKQALIQAPTLAPNFAWAHPRTEHFVPIAVAFGAGACPTINAAVSESCEGTHAVIHRAFHQVAMGHMALDSYIFADSNK